MEAHRSAMPVNRPWAIYMEGWNDVENVSFTNGLSLIVEESLGEKTG
jgi:hypothetical protein